MSFRVAMLQGYSHIDRALHLPRLILYRPLEGQALPMHLHWSKLDTIDHYL